MKTLQRLVNKINDHGPFILLTPCISVIGNCSEEIYFGLLRAKDERKKLVILYPYDLPWKFRFPVTNREVFQVESPHGAKVPRPLLVLGRLALTAVYGPMRALSLILGKVLGQWAHLPGHMSHPSLGATTLWKREEEPDRFRWDEVQAYRWTERMGTKLEVGLAPQKRARAHAMRLEMGIPEGAWFVGLHVRERGFYNDKEEYTCRNGTIANYLPAIKEITSRGGWVVRLGDKSMTPLPPMERVIDYPHTKQKSDLMDMYWLSECRFYIGMSSGILDTAWLFQRPMVLTNMTNMTFVYPRKPGDRGIAKHVYSKKLGRFLSVKELFEDFDSQHFHVLGDDYEQVENSPEELRDVVLEFMEGLDGHPQPLTDLQQEANRERIEGGRKMLENVLFGNHYDDMHNRYRMASRIESSQGALGRNYLAANWEINSRNKAAVGKAAS